jgi:hypothetical protein
MPSKLVRAVLLCTVTLALAGCLLFNKPVLDIGKGATDLPEGLFAQRTDSGKKVFRMERHARLYLYGDSEGKSNEKLILSFHPIGDAFFIVVVMQPGAPIYYGVLDARSKDRYLFTSLECSHMPDAYVAQPSKKGSERCNVTDGERLIAIANRYKADMMAGQTEPSRATEYVPVQ